MGSPVVQPPFQNGVPETFGAISGGVVDTTAAMLNALNSGQIIDGRNRSYGITGSIRLDQLANFKGLQNCTLVQLAPASARTLYNSGKSGFILVNVKIDLGGNFVDGDMATNAGIYFDGCSKFKVDGCEVYNGGFVTGIYIANCLECSITNNYVHDLTYNRPLNDPIDDCIQGYDIFGCSRSDVIGNRVRNLTGFLAGVASPLYTRGFAINGDNNAVSFTNNIASICDQCFDSSGSSGNSGGVFASNIAVDAGTWGFKFANTQREMVINANVAIRSGLGGFVVSGLSSAVAADHYPKDMIINAGIAIDTGAPNPITGTSVWPQPANAPTGFKVLQNPNVDLNTPIDVTFSNCKAIDRQASPTMKFGYVNQIPATGIGFNTLSNCVSIGHTSTEQSGFHRYLAKIGVTVDLNFATATPTAINCNSDVDVSIATMHSTVTNNQLIIAPVIGTYTVDGVVAFAANATGSRIVDVWLNGLVTGFTFKKTAEASGITYVPFHAQLVCSAITDNIRVIGTQDSGGNLLIDHTKTFITVRLVERA